jgi:hypothetical protein
VSGMSTTSLNWLWIIVIGAILVGCHVPIGINEPLFEEAPSFRMSGTEAIGELWWTEFGDTSLDQQVREALEGSLTLTATRERVRAANALARRESSAFYPELSGTAGVSYTETDSTEGVEDYEFGLGWRSVMKLICGAASIHWWKPSSCVEGRRRKLTTQRRSVSRRR